MLILGEKLLENQHFGKARKNFIGHFSFENLKAFATLPGSNSQTCKIVVCECARAKREKSMKAQIAFLLSFQVKSFLRQSLYSTKF